VAVFVVLGSNSFSGSHFVDHLLGLGEKVIGISRSAEPAPAFLPYKKRDGDFEFVQADLNHDLERIMEVVAENQAAYVVNYAAQSMVGQSWQHPEHWFMTNVVSTVKLHDRLRECEFLQRYVHISTPEVYGSCEGLVGPEAPFNPSTPYAVSRAAADMSLRSFHANYGFPVVYTRAANVFGPGQQLYRIVPRTILCVLAGERLQLHGGGHSVRSFIDIRDVNEGTYKAACAGTSGATYHLSTTRHISIREVVEEVLRQMETPFEDVVEVVGDRAGKDAAYLLDSSLAREELGWEPTRTFEQGVADTIAWLREEWEELRTQPRAYVHKA
jgi:dTDP-glucose 4,6-dehydratase